MNHNILEEVLEIKDLGVMMDSNMKFRSQTAVTIAKANRILSMIKRSFTPVIFYKSLVRPLLEYSNTVWGLFINKQWRKSRGEQPG